MLLHTKPIMYNCRSHWNFLFTVLFFYSLYRQNILSELPIRMLLQGFLSQCSLSFCSTIQLEKKHECKISTNSCDSTFTIIFFRKTYQTIWVNLLQDNPSKIFRTTKMCGYCICFQLSQHFPHQIDLGVRCQPTASARPLILVPSAVHVREPHLR